MKLGSLIVSTINYNSQKRTLNFTNLRKSCHLFTIYGFATIKSIQTSTIKATQIENIKYYEEQQEFRQIEKNYNHILADYPFVKTSLKRLRFEDVEGQLSQNAKALICWKCLQIKDQEWLSKANQILFPQNAHLKFTERKSNLSGNAIFQAYFQKRLNSLILKINDPSSTSHQIISSFNTLLHMEPCAIVKEEIKNIKNSIIEKSGGQIILAMLTHIRVRNQVQYEEYLQKTVQVLQKGQLSRNVKVRIVYILVSIPYFYRHYTRETVKLLFKVLKNNLLAMSNQMIFRSIKAVYQNNSKYAIYFVQALMKFVMDLNLQKQGQRVQYLMEIILKTISYSSVLETNYQNFIVHLIENTQQYRKLLQDYKYQRQTFISLLLLQGRNQNHEFSSEFKSKINKYVESYIKDLTKKEVIQYDNLFTFLKLAKKYRFLLKDQLNQAVRQKVSEVIITSQGNTELSLIYETLNLLLSEKKSYEDQEMNIKRQPRIILLVKKYFSQSCQVQEGRLVIKRNINQSINLLFKVQHNQINLGTQFLPDVLSTNIQNKGYSMDAATMQNLVRYLLQKKFDKQEQQLREFFKKLQPIISGFFNSRRVNYRTTMNVLELSAKVNHQNNNIYRKIQRSILEILQKYPDFVISSHDLHVLKQNLVKRGFATKNIQALVKQGIENPQEWRQVKKRFVQRQGGFAQKQQWTKRKVNVQNKQGES